MQVKQGRVVVPADAAAAAAAAAGRVAITASHNMLDSRAQQSCKRQRRGNLRVCWAVRVGRGAPDDKGVGRGMAVGKLAG